MEIRDKGERNMTQNEQVLKHLKEYGSITPLEAMVRYDIMRLSGRIFELRKEGHNIITKDRVTKKGKHYAEYILKGEE